MAKLLHFLTLSPAISPKLARILKFTRLQFTSASHLPPLVLRIDTCLCNFYLKENKSFFLTSMKFGVCSSRDYI